MAKKRYKIIFDRELCIGALACADVSPKYWKVADDGKVDLSGGKLNKKTGKWEIVIPEEDFRESKDADDSCPVLAIEIYEIDENGKEKKIR